jgi:hypothetical protein
VVYNNRGWSFQKKGLRSQAAADEKKAKELAQ